VIAFLVVLVAGFVAVLVVLPRLPQIRAWKARRIAERDAADKAVRIHQSRNVEGGRRA